MGAALSSVRNEMSGIAKATLAAALLSCGLSNVSAQEATKGQWLKDGACALFSADAHPGDTVSWTGSCTDGYAEGLGTATFTREGQPQTFTSKFAHGVIQDGHVVARWGQGWSYDGDMVGGHFNGFGILITDASDRFEGQWADGKLSGFGVLLRANGERYAGDWKDDKPNGKGELRHADGSLLAGTFVDGTLANADSPIAIKATPTAPDISSVAPDNASGAPFDSVSGKTLIAVDGSSIALDLIEGGMELQVVPAEGKARKTTFTFMTDRMGTVVEDSDSPSKGSSITGFFRLTGKGVEIRYADGRSALLSASPDGGVQMALDGDVGASCRAWYPAGHAFSEGEKKMALNAYARKLGLQVAASDTGNACSSEPKPQAANQVNNQPTINGSPPGPVAPHARVAASRTPAERRVAVKVPARMAKASYHIGDYQPAKDEETVTVKTSEIHLIDTPAMNDANQINAIAMPFIGASTAAPTMASDKNDASHCLKVDSDGRHWGFRNSCDFAVQFAYCMAGGSDNLTACSKDVTVSVAGSVAAYGFGTLITDTSLSDKDAAHNFRWIACGGGAGEVVAHLDHAEPPAGRCERSRTASVN
jgi:hypothetical protein